MGSRSSAILKLKTQKSRREKDLKERLPEDIRLDVPKIAPATREDYGPYNYLASILFHPCASIHQQNKAIIKAFMELEFRLISAGSFDFEESFNCDFD